MNTDIATVSTPLRRCNECQLNLVRDVLRALGSCPRWGMRRAGVESPCASFAAKAVPTVPVLPYRPPPDRCYR